LLAEKSLFIADQTLVVAEKSPNESYRTFSRSVGLGNLTYGLIGKSAQDQWVSVGSVGQQASVGRSMVSKQGSGASAWWLRLAANQCWSLPNGGAGIRSNNERLLAFVDERMGIRGRAHAGGRSRARGRLT